MNKNKGLRDGGKEFNSGGPNKFVVLNLIDQEYEYENKNVVMSPLVYGSGP